MCRERAQGNNAEEHDKGQPDPKSRIVLQRQHQGGSEKREHEIKIEIPGRALVSKPCLFDSEIQIQTRTELGSACAAKRASEQGRDLAACKMPIKVCTVHNDHQLIIPGFASAEAVHEEHNNVQGQNSPDSTNTVAQPRERGAISHAAKNAAMTRNLGHAYGLICSLSQRPKCLLSPLILHRILTNVRVARNPEMKKNVSTPSTPSFPISSCVIQHKWLRNCHKIR